MRFWIFINVSLIKSKGFTTGWDQCLKKNDFKYFNKTGFFSDVWSVLRSILIKTFVKYPNQVKFTFEVFVEIFSQKTSQTYFRNEINKSKNLSHIEIFILIIASPVRDILQTWKLVSLWVKDLRIFYLKKTFSCVPKGHCHKA